MLFGFYSTTLSTVFSTITTKKGQNIAKKKYQKLFQSLKANRWKKVQK